MEDMGDERHAQVAVKPECEDVEPGSHMASDNRDAQAVVKAETVGSANGDGSTELTNDNVVEVTKLDEAIGTVLPAEEPASATQAIVKLENLNLQCTTCGEEFFSEDQYNDHACGKLSTTLAPRDTGLLPCASSFVSATVTSSTSASDPDAGLILNAVSESDIRHNDFDNKSFDCHSESLDIIHPTSAATEPLIKCTSVDNKSDVVCKIENINKKANILLKLSESIVGKGFQCYVCEKVFNKRSFLMLHVMCHIKNGPFICVVCRYKCHSNAHLKIHLRLHGDEKRIACSLCQYKCSAQSRLVEHIRRHMDKMRFVCKLCTYKCTYKRNLVQHMLTHTGEKPFACKSCQYECTNRSNLAQHMRSHNGGKLYYACKSCQYKCTNRINLAQHMMSHTGEKPYACELCRYKSSSYNGLLRHSRWEHRI